jgi:magnesium chelatase family protein
MDRIDMVLDVSRVDPALLLESATGEGSAVMRERASDVRARSIATRGCANSQLSGTALLDACTLSSRSRTALQQVGRGMRFSGRGMTRLLRIARTIADMEGEHTVTSEHIAEAVGFRARGER